MEERSVGPDRVVLAEVVEVGPGVVEEYSVEGEMW